jgi:hypothetical protein
MKLLSIFKPTGQAIKEKILKNNEMLLDVMAKKAEGARQCPFMMGNKCINQFCEMFMEFKSIDNKGNEIKYSRCAFVQTPLLIIELNRNIRDLKDTLILKKDVEM